VRHESEPYVLVVDDLAAVREVLTRVLDQHGVDNVREAATGAQALAEAQAWQPTAIILDNSLPDTTGLNLLPELRETCRTARIVMFSADPYLGPEALTGGADAFIDKMRPTQDLIDVLWPAGPPSATPRAAGGHRPQPPPEGSDEPRARDGCLSPQQRPADP